MHPMKPDTERKIWHQKEQTSFYRALIERRYPKELCSEIAYKYLNTDYTATRMLGYLYRMTEPPAVEVVVDEMIAILSDREQLIKKKESEHAQAVISEIYREGL